MAIGKARDRWRGRRPKPVPRDPESTEAYEEGWYALLARQASDGAGPAPDAEAGAGAAPDRAEPDEPDADPPANVTPLVARPRPAAVPAPVRAATPPPRARPTENPSVRPEPAPMRIGVRRLSEPEAVYLEYLTSSRHRDYFRAELWRGSGPITPVHLWRANHLGAGWDVAAVDRFMEDAAHLAAELVAAAPRSAAPGQAERRLWIERFLSAEWVRSFGVARVSKSLHAMLPELVPDLDAEMMPWARRVWLGLGDAAEDDVATWVETCEAIEDVLVLRGRELGRIVRRLRTLAPALGPLGRLGPVMAAFWQGYWSEAGRDAPAPLHPATPSEPRPARRATAKASTKRAPAKPNPAAKPKPAKPKPVASPKRASPAKGTKAPEPDAAGTARTRKTRATAEKDPSD
jgi:hypothetical protein